jgi:hypothetical protein
VKQKEVGIHFFFVETGAKSSCDRSISLDDRVVARCHITSSHGMPSSSDAKHKLNY